MGSGSSPGSHSSSNQKSLKTEMLSILLMVALFKGSAALACEGDQALEEGLGGTITSVNFPNNYEDNTDFHVDYSHGGGCKDFITIFPPVDGQTEFCGSLIILSPGKGRLYTLPREEPV